MQHLNKEFKLTESVTLVNRLAKSAMSENMANKDGSPSDLIIQAYKRWGRGGAGLYITGNVMIDSKAIGEPRNVIVEDKRHFDLLKTWANTFEKSKAHIWPQINHPGRQAFGSINKEVVGPSAIPLNMKGANLMFAKPRALEEDEIYDIINRFGTTAQIMKEAGFNGVQIHGAHGYLVSQFLSPLSNIRKDQWGGSLENRSRFVIEVYKNIRSKVGMDFPIGIKINSADFQRGGFTEEESMEVVQILSSLGMDLIEISGGTYEKASMMGANRKKSTVEREAYFMEYIDKVRQLIKTPLMLTGGFRTTKLMDEAIANDQLDIIGLGRPFTLYPNLGNDILKKRLKRIKVPTPKTGIKMIDQMGFLDIMWHEIHIKRLGQGKKPDPKLSPFIPLMHNLKTTIQKSMPDLRFVSKVTRGF